MKSFVLVISAAALVIVAIALAYRGAASAGQQSVSVTGCLQEGVHQRDYILTHQNEPPIPVGTSDSAQSVTIRRDELSEARNAYRLLPAKNVDLGPLVGKQIRVSGTVVVPARMPARGTLSNESGSGPEITESDLAALHITTVSTMSGACGTATRRE
jgi:hypothetical protein